MTTPKRFYKEVAFRDSGQGFEILLDGKPVGTPARKPLLLEQEALAKAIVSEWQAQGDKLEPDTMPMTKRAYTAIDRVSGREAEVVADMVSYAGSDLLCYRAESPQELVSKQCDRWDPVLDWARTQLGAGFSTQTGITPVEQPQDALAAIGEKLRDYDTFALTPMHTMTTLTGSTLLVLAFVEGHLPADEAWTAAHVDEDWQIEKWGDDEEASARRALRRAEFDADVAFFNHLNQ